MENKDYHTKIQSKNRRIDTTSTNILA